MRLTVVGCSPAWPNPGGAQSGYLVEHNGQQVVVSVASACSGVNSLVGFGIIGAAALWFIRGSVVRRVSWLALEAEPAAYAAIRTDRLSQDRHVVSSPVLHAARNSSAIAAEARRFDQQATADQLTQTPTILVGKTGGKLAQVTDIEAAIKAALRQ